VEVREVEVGVCLANQSPFLKEPSVNLEADPLPDRGAVDSRLKQRLFRLELKEPLGEFL
jgi:hypothetical protein